jgi:transcriptional regulator with XRE-family HTH domain
MESISLSRSQRLIGKNIMTWRKLNGLTMAHLAERAGISRQTVRAIEQGSGSVSSENLMRVLWVFGLDTKVVTATDPYETDVGRLRADEHLPQRVRK